MNRRELLAGAAAVALTPVLPAVGVAEPLVVDGVKVVTGESFIFHRHFEMMRWYMWAANDGVRYLDDEDAHRGDLEFKPVPKNSDAEAYIAQFMADVEVERKAHAQA